jgi:integrase
MRGTTRHVCRDDKGKLLRGQRTGDKRLHIAGCRGGTWAYAVRVPTVQDEYAYLRRSVFDTRADAEAELRRVITLLELAGDNAALRRQIGTAVHDSTLRGGQLDEERIRRKIGTRRDPSQPTQTVTQWCEEWLAGQGHVRLGTRLGWERRIANYIVPHLGDIRLDELSAVHVRELFDAVDRRAAGTSLDDDPPDERRRRSAPGLPLQHQVLNLLRSIIKAAIDQRVIVHNPLVGFKLESYETPERDTWSPTQVQTFLRAAEGDELYALFRVALGYGLRRGELLGLRWSDLDLDTRVLSVRQQVGWIHGRPTVDRPKTSKSRRSFSIDRDTVAVLRRHRLAQHPKNVEWQEWDLVFCEPNGRPLRPYTPLFVLKALARAAGLPSLTLHELRHTAATNMLASGVPAKVVSQRLGHTTVAMTVDLYGHVLLEQDQDAADTIGGILG